MFSGAVRLPGNMDELGWIAGFQVTEEIDLSGISYFFLGNIWHIAPPENGKAAEFQSLRLKSNDILFSWAKLDDQSVDILRRSPV